MLRLFDLIKNGTLLFVLGYAFGSCITKQDSVILLEDNLLNAAEAVYGSISSHIRPKKTGLNAAGSLIDENLSQKNLTAVHLSLLDLKNKLHRYEQLTKYPIYRTVLENIKQTLSGLKVNIDNLSDVANEAQLKKEYDELCTYIDASIAASVSQKQAMQLASPAG